MSPRQEKSRPLRWMILDFDSYFASVEQTERPELRGQPVGVAPMDSEATCVIAASYEARRFGVKCGTLVADARIMCPGIHIVPATHHLYTTYRDRIDAVVNEVLPKPEKREYIDEMAFQLVGDEMRPARARELALLVKARLRQNFGPYLTGTVGIAPNRYLAKVASDMRKPNGLTVIAAEDLPEIYRQLKLRDLPGINRRMEVRFNAAGIFSVLDLYDGARIDARRGAGSILGDEWWYELHGEDRLPKETHTRSLGHSHVLPRENRNRAGVKAIMHRLLGKALARMREGELRAGGLGLYISGIEPWRHYERIEPTWDDRRLIELISQRLENAEYYAPKKIGLVFDSLRPWKLLDASLFEDDAVSVIEFGAALDRINQRYGKHKVFAGSIFKVREAATEKIAFGKGSLFVEGRGDHVLGRPLAFDPPPAPDPYDELRRRRDATLAAARRFAQGEEHEFFDEALRLDAEELEVVSSELDRPEDRPPPLRALGTPGDVASPPPNSPADSKLGFEERRAALAEALSHPLNRAGADCSWIAPPILGTIQAR